MPFYPDEYDDVFNKACAFRESSQRFSHGEKTKFLLDLEKDIGVVSIRRLYIHIRI